MSAVGIPVLQGGEDVKETVAELRAEIGALPEAGQKAIYEAADRIREAAKKAGAAGAVGLSLVCFELAEQEEEKNESH